MFMTEAVAVAFAVKIFDHNSRNFSGLAAEFSDSISRQIYNSRNFSGLAAVNIENAVKFDLQ